jgi:hypothetical protein
MDQRDINTMSLIAHKKLKTILRKSIYLLGINRVVANVLPFQRPPLLILSYPRSGSSWIGKVLSTSPSVAYLREPVTQPYMFRHGGKHALVDLAHDPQAYQIYRKLGDEAFGGFPSWHPNVINNIDDFRFSNRRTKRLLIKEVNPKVTRFYCHRYKPKAVLILRHPAAIALSFYQLGWLNSPDVQLENDNPKANEWETFGYSYGSVMHHAIEELKGYGNYEIVVYRHLAEDPTNNFKNLFKSLGLDLPKNYDDIIKKYCFSPKQSVEKSDIERTSRNLVFKWYEELTSQQVESIRCGLFDSPLEYFREENYWVPSNQAHNS